MDQAYEAAKAAGLKRYFSGTCCRQGHSCERFVANRTCVECHLERGRRVGAGASKRYREKNCEKIQLYAKNRRASDPNYRKRCAKANEKWRMKNPEQSRKLARDAYQRQPEKWAERARNRRAKTRGANGNHTAADVAEIRKMQRDRCALPTCRAKLCGGGTIDHIHPLKTGGRNDRRNLQILCRSCNSRKSDRDQIEFLQARGFLI